MAGWLLFLVPLGVGTGASTWLWGVVFGKQRLDAPPVRLRVVRGAAGLVAIGAAMLFFLRERWPHPLGLQAGATFMALMLTLAALLYSLVPPQRDL